ncbi:nuclear transport factor 2 family protein [Dyadobacter sp. CY261]|uniref:nuclear transport factor 2 family protein n=1 Tax=Dyadobacter sp. CY261 TaxID=2907203 RepID=UPI001F387A39|nr:nuclear transport factor 2 family protein [Dyadobacter sp. CY261]MCF0071163.1 nuclear transport factor 2 family protein [Dyadobacter sp. CY261]
MPRPAPTLNRTHTRRYCYGWHLCAALLIGCVYSVRSQQISPDLALMIREEKAFAAKAEASDVPTAFLTYLDSAGMIFNGVDAVNGIVEYGKSPKGGKDLLKWYPLIAHVSQSGDIGFTSGPFQFIAERGQDAVGSGYFFSVWRKNAAGRFKVMLDGGVIHSQDPKEAFIRDPEPQSNTAYDYILPVAKVKDNNPQPWKAEEAFLAAAGTNVGEAYKQFLADEVVLLRSDRPFGRTKTEALATIAQQEIQSYQFIRSGQGIAKDGDLAYCFGKAKAVKGGKTVEGFFTRVWQQRPEGWRIVAEQVSLFR